MLIPIPERHIVVTGDTVFALSNDKVDMRTLVELNTLKPLTTKKGTGFKDTHSSSRVGVGSKEIYGMF